MALRVLCRSRPRHRGVVGAVIGMGVTGIMAARGAGYGARSFESSRAYKDLLEKFPDAPAPEAGRWRGAARRAPSWRARAPARARRSARVIDGVLSRNRRETHVFLRLACAASARAKASRDCRRCPGRGSAGRDALEHFSRFDELVQAGHAVAQGHVRLVLVVNPETGQRLRVAWWRPRRGSPAIGAAHAMGSTRRAPAAPPRASDATRSHAAMPPARCAALRGRRLTPTARRDL